MTYQRIFSYDSQFVKQSSRLACELTTERGAVLYDRERHLPSLVRLVPRLPVPKVPGLPEPRFPAPELPEPKSPVLGDQARCRFVLRRLAQALRAQRRLGRAGHWTYDLNRHIALQQAFVAEARTLRTLRGNGNGPA